MATKKSQKVSFFHVLRLTPRGPIPSQQIPWDAVLKTWSKRSLADQEITDLIYHPTLDLALPVLGIHKPTSGAFRSTIDLTTQNIHDVLTRTNTDGHLVADSTAVALLPEHNLFALCKGNQSSPGEKTLITFLEHTFPPEDDSSWTIHPVWDPAKLDALKGGERRAKRIEMVYETQQDLFNVHLDDGASGIAQALNSLAQAVGAELRIRLDVSVSPKNPSTRDQAQRRLWRAFTNSADSLIGRVDRANVFVEDSDEDEHVLNFVRRRLSVQTTIPDLDDNAQTFTALQEAVVRVAGEQHTRVRGLVNGGGRHDTEGQGA